MHHLATIHNVTDDYRRQTDATLFNNSELRDLYVYGSVVSWILGCDIRPDVAVCHTYH